MIEEVYRMDIKKGALAFSNPMERMIIKGKKGTYLILPGFTSRYKHTYSQRKRGGGV